MTFWLGYISSQIGSLLGLLIVLTKLYFKEI